MITTRNKIITQYLDGTTATSTEYRREAGVNQIATKTIDLNQAAATYDLLTGTTQDCILKSLSFRMPNRDASGDATLTSISIQTDDATAQEIISSTDGAVANLTAETQINWTGNIYIKTGTKIQLTIAGGAADAETITDIATELVAVSDGGYLT